MLFFPIWCFGYLTLTQQIQVQRILQNPDSPIEIKLKVKQVVFYHYLPWIKKECQDFCKNNMDLITYLKYNSIKGRDKTGLYEYAYLGFSKALHNFNGNCSTITRYAEPFIKHEIYKGITMETKESKYREHLQNVLIPKCDKSVRYLYKNKIQTTTNNNKFIIREINDIVKTMGQKERSIFYYRYDSITLKKIRPVKEICKIMGFSEETYRKHFNLILKTISNTRNAI
jgi:RNA polymerase sigma factor (sigma-70 family)